MALLRVEKGEGAPFEIALKNHALSIGRGVSNDLSFSNPWLSRLHARVTPRAGRFFVQDLGSRNGTFVNGQELQGEYELRHGDTIELGEVVLSLEVDTAFLQVAPTAQPLSGQGTVVLRSEELSLDRFREAQPASGRVDSLWPALNAAAAALLHHYPLDELVEVALDRVLAAVAADRAALLLRSGAEQEPQVRAVRGFAAGEELRLSRTIIDAVLERHEAVLTIDAQSDERFDQAQSILLQGIRSIICVPLWNDGRVDGLIYLDHRFAGRNFGEHELRLVGLIANMLAIKVQNAMLWQAQIEKQRFEEQLAVAAEIQRKLLPDADPEVAGYDIGGASSSCYEIGGDYFDFCAHDDGRWSVVIADISGKGVGAALLMASLQASLRTLTHHIDDPAELVHALNRALVESSPSNKFATLFYAELDPRQNLLRYVNGGHNPAFWAHGQEVTALGSTGPIVGIVPLARFECRQIELAPGDRVLLYTDGISELNNPAGEELGEAPLAELMAVDPREDSRALMARVRRTMDDFRAGGKVGDDQTLVVIRRLPLAAESC